MALQFRVRTWATPRLPRRKSVESYQRPSLGRQTLWCLDLHSFSASCGPQATPTPLLVFAKKPGIDRLDFVVTFEFWYCGMHISSSHGRVPASCGPIPDTYAVVS
jgi:hypothetical protein